MVQNPAPIVIITKTLRWCMVLSVVRLNLALMWCSHNIMYNHGSWMAYWWGVQLQIQLLSLVYADQPSRYFAPSPQQTCRRDWLINWLLWGDYYDDLNQYGRQYRWLMRGLSIYLHRVHDTVNHLLSYINRAIYYEYLLWDIYRTKWYYNTQWVYITLIVKSVTIL